MEAGEGKVRDMPRRKRSRREKLRLAKEGWGMRMLAARGQGPKGYVSPSTLGYGALVMEYCSARDAYREYRRPGWRWG